MKVNKPLLFIAIGALLLVLFNAYLEASIYEDLLGKGYYQLLRLFITGISAYYAYLCFNSNYVPWFWTHLGVAVIFNPIYKLYFSKPTWLLFDFVTVVIYLTFLIKFWRYPNENKPSKT